MKRKIDLQPMTQTISKHINHGPWLFQDRNLRLPNRSVDVPKPEMDASESKQKYALSRCTRRTYLIVTETVALKEHLKKYHPNMTHSPDKVFPRINVREQFSVQNK